MMTELLEDTKAPLPWSDPRTSASTDLRAWLWPVVDGESAANDILFDFDIER